MRIEGAQKRMPDSNPPAGRNDDEALKCGRDAQATEPRRPAFTTGVDEGVARLH